MMKTLKDMTLEELWQLFPIDLVPHNPLWREWAAEEMDSLRLLLSAYAVQIYHIGSTAIPDIYAKPIIDLLVLTPSTARWPEIACHMKQNGYILMSYADTHMSFNKGYTLSGYAERVFHIHFPLHGELDRLIFRDYLIAYPAAAKSYEELKRSLLPTFRHDRDAYTAAKSPFITHILDKAKAASIYASIPSALSSRIDMSQVTDIARRAGSSASLRELLWHLTSAPDRRTAINSLWILTHLDASARPWLQTLQPHFIRHLLASPDAAIKRMLLNLLRRQDFNAESESVIYLLDYCFSKINAECEPYAVRCFSIYTALRICRPYPELIAELEQYLDLLSTQPLSPGLKSALRQTRQAIARSRR